MLSVLGGADASWVREGLPFGGVLAPQVGFDGLLQFRGLGEVGVPFGDESGIGLFVVLFVLFFILRFGFQEHDILAHHIKSEGLALADALDLAVGKREDIAAPAVAKGSLHAVGGIEGGFDGGDGCGDGCGCGQGVGPVAAEFFHPWLDARLSHGRKMVQHDG